MVISNVFPISLTRKGCPLSTISIHPFAGDLNQNNKEVKINKVHKVERGRNKTSIICNNMIVYNEKIVFTSHSCYKNHII